MRITFSLALFFFSFFFLFWFLIILHLQIYNTQFTHGKKYPYILPGLVQKRKSKFKDFSRTFQGLFTFFQESFFIDGNSPNTAYTQDFCPIQDRNAFPFRARCFCPISALRIVYARYFRFCLSRFPLCKVSLPVAFDSYYLNQIE